MPGNNTQPYNGRYLGTGNGGYAGSYFYSELAQGINYGFATANTDMGTGGSVVPPTDGISADGLVGHPEKWIDFGWRATSLMTQFSKALIQAYYGTAASHSYFAGCSTGGQQALMEAQRFPNDYDGKLAGAPAHNRTHLHTVLIAQYAATIRPRPVRRRRVIFRRPPVSIPSTRRSSGSASVAITGPRPIISSPILGCAISIRPPSSVRMAQWAGNA